MNDINNETYRDKIYREIELDEKRSIVIGTSTRESDNSVLADIRLFRLYHGETGASDNVKRPTKRGLKIRVDTIPEVIAALEQVYKDYRPSK